MEYNKRRILHTLREGSQRNQEENPKSSACLLRAKNSRERKGCYESTKHQNIPQTRINSSLPEA